MSRSSASKRATDRARVHAVLEHADRPITVSDLAFRLRYGIPWYRMRFALDRLVMDETVVMAVGLFRARSGGRGCYQWNRAVGYTLVREA